MKFFVPSWNGDFRLEPVDESTCRLTVVDPTPLERDMLRSFLAKLRESGKSKAKVVNKTLTIRAPLAEVAPLLVESTLPEKTTLTAVRFEDGRLRVVEGARSAELEPAVRAAAAEGATAAVSVKRATPSCPECWPAECAPATEVLYEFLDPAQRRDWERWRLVEVVGGLSGHRYLLSHRHAPWARRWGRMCFDADDRQVVHFHDVSVPPEEEVLGALLVLRHREPWLRNEATCLGGRFTDVFKNPFGGIEDGLYDAGVYRAFGTAFSAFAGASA